MFRTTFRPKVPSRLDFHKVGLTVADGMFTFLIATTATTLAMDGWPVQSMNLFGHLMVTRQEQCTGLL